MEEDEDDDVSMGADDAHIAALIEQYKAQGGIVGQGNCVKFANGKGARLRLLNARHTSQENRITLLLPFSFHTPATASDAQAGITRLEREQYEAEEAAHGDAAFHQLQRRLARMPEQVRAIANRAQLYPVWAPSKYLQHNLQSLPNCRCYVTTAEARHCVPHHSSQRRLPRRRVLTVAYPASLRCNCSRD